MTFLQALCFVGLWFGLMWVCVHMQRATEHDDSAGDREQ